MTNAPVSEQGGYNNERPENGTEAGSEGRLRKGSSEVVLHNSSARI